MGTAKTLPPINPGYTKYLNSPAWQTRSAEFRRTHPTRCTICGQKRGVQVHHLSYTRIRNEPDTDLTLLCNRCHQTVHHYHHQNGGTIRAATEHITAERQARRHRRETKKQNRRQTRRRNYPPGWLATKLDLPPGTTTIRYKQQTSTRNVGSRATSEGAPSTD